MSMCFASAWGLPVSATSASRNSLNRRLISSATAYISSLRFAMSIDAQGPSSAASAAFTAASTSSFPASDTMPTRRLSTGERFSNALPDFAATYSPLMKLRICLVMTRSPSMSVGFRGLLGGFVVRFALRDVGEELGAAVRRRQSPEEERKAHDRLHLLPPPPAPPPAHPH